MGRTVDLGISDDPRISFSEANLGYDVNLGNGQGGRAGVKWIDLNDIFKTYTTSRPLCVGFGFVFDLSCIPTLACSPSVTHDIFNTHHPSHHRTPTPTMPPKKQRQPTYVLGVGMTKFIKPRGKVDYTELGYEAGVKAMLDAHINYDDVEQGIACYCYGDSTCGQRVFYQFGMTRIPIVNVNNNCSTGSTGIAMARDLIGAGAADCILVVGFEKMAPGSLQSAWQDRESPVQPTYKMMAQTRGVSNGPGAAQMFGNAGREYMEK